MIILGVDPGTQVTGYGIIRVVGNSYEAIDYGCIRPPKSYELPDRYLAIFEGIEQIIKLHQPEAVSVETQFVQKNIQSAIKLGMARGAVIIAARKQKLPVFEYTPKKAKLAVVGNGSASKEQIVGMIQRLLRLSEPPKPEDAADALALAICLAHDKGAKEKCMLT